MDVRKGYKMTDIGVVPEDWGIYPFSELGNLSKSKISPQRDNKIYKCIELEHIEQGTGQIIGSVDSIHQLSDKWLFSEGDVLFGKLRPYLRKFYLANFSGVCTTEIWVLKPTSKTISPYLYLVVQSDRFIESANLSTGTKMPRAEWKTVSQTTIPLPPTLIEQRAIATALTDVDNLISALDRLINKKKAIKQGAMQELLTGKRRLEGFEGEWEERSLPEVCWFQEGPGLRNWQFTKDGMKVINVTNLENGYLNLERTDRHISKEEFERMYKHFEIDNGDIVMASSGNSYGKVSIVREQDLPLVMNTSVIRFKALKALDYYYLLTFLKSKYFKDQIDLLITGGAQPNFGPFHLRKVTISVPIEKKEQTAIAQILTDMDAEITVLEQQRDKYKAVKQGMMQELLTGKTRLI